MEHLLLGLLDKVDDQLKCTTATWAAKFEAQMQQGSKPIFHLEAFVARFMSDYKDWMVKALTF